MKAFRKTSFSVYPPDGTRCRGAYYPGDTRAVGVHVHGFRSSVANNKARFFLDHALQRGYSWSHFDLPCHGNSEGKFSDFRVSAALDSVLAVLHRFRGVPLVLLGSSMGAWLSMLAARKLASSSSSAPAVTIAGAVLIAPAFDFFRQYFHNEPAEAMRQWQRDGVRQFTDHYDNQPYQLDYELMADGLRHNLLDRPGVYDFPIRIFHGDRDEIVPLSLSHRFKEASAGSDITVHVIENGDHALTPQLPLIASEIDMMFDRVQVPEAV